MSWEQGLSSILLKVGEARLQRVDGVALVRRRRAGLRVAGDSKHVQVLSGRQHRAAAVRVARRAQRQERRGLAPVGALAEAAHHLDLAHAGPLRRIRERHRHGPPRVHDGAPGVGGRGAVAGAAVRRGCRHVGGGVGAGRGGGVAAGASGEQGREGQAGDHGGAVHGLPARVSKRRASASPCESARLLGTGPRPWNEPRSPGSDSARPSRPGTPPATFFRRKGSLGLVGRIRYHGQVFDYGAPLPG